jgi:hypothetical protein
MFLRNDEESVGGVAISQASPQGQRAGTARASWTVLASLAGDNDLEGALLGDLKEMERVGSRPGQVEIVAQVDRARGYTAADGNWKGTRRYYVTKSEAPKRIGSTLLDELGEANTGDPRVLQDFVSFGARRYPAQATLLILVNGRPRRATQGRPMRARAAA